MQFFVTHLLSVRDKDNPFCASAKVKKVFVVSKNNSAEFKVKYFLRVLKESSAPSSNLPVPQFSHIYVCSSLFVFFLNVFSFTLRIEIVATAKEHGHITKKSW
jgi:hypothetical protein